LKSALSTIPVLWSECGFSHTWLSAQPDDKNNFFPALS
jgi:hypothetical protein